jgi:hypothetical protein
MQTERQEKAAAAAAEGAHKAREGGLAKGRELTWTST